MQAVLLTITVVATLGFFGNRDVCAQMATPEQQSEARPPGISPPSTFKLPAYIANARVHVAGTPSSYIAFRNPKVGSGDAVAHEVEYSVGSSAETLCYISGGLFTGRWTQVSADTFLLTGESQGRRYRCPMTVKIEFSPQMVVKGGEWTVGSGRGGFLPPETR